LVQWSGLYVTCNDAAAGNYFMNLDAAEMTEYTWISLTNCNSQARWIINIGGTGDVTFSGGSFPAGPNQVTWNIQGSGRNINVGGTQVEGNILAPFNNINQPTGLIIGKVVANNIISLQINKAQCFQSTGSSCGNGIVEVGEQCDGGDCCVNCQFASSSSVCRPSVAQCDQPESCTGSTSTCPPDQNWGFETSCSGLDFPVGGDYSFTDYDVIVYGSFSAGTGDVERRMAVEGDFLAGAGWSVGYQIDSSEAYAPYSLVVGGNAHWSSGAIYPDGSVAGLPAETMFVGGTFSGAADLASKVTGSCGSGNAGCLNSYFSASQACYSGFQTALSSHSDNTAHLAQWSTLTITCNSATDMKYYVSLTGAEISSVTGVSMVNCNDDAQWVVNVVGTDDVTFSGGSFGPGAPQVVVNVLGSGRTINVGAYQFDGSLLAPNNILHQTGGVIIGKIVVAEVTSFVQFNKYICWDGHADSSFYVTD